MFRKFVSLNEYFFYSKILIELKKILYKDYWRKHLLKFSTFFYQCKNRKR